jgi:hypothetical protein
VQKRIDPCNGYPLLASQLDLAAFQIRQFDIRLQNVLLRNLIGFIANLGNLAKLSQQFEVCRVQFDFPSRQIVIQIGIGRGFGQH